MKNERQLIRLVGIGQDESDRTRRVVTLKAQGDEAQSVLQWARAYKVPVVYRQGVVALLEHIEPDDEVPDELFEILDILIKEVERDFVY